MSSVTPGSVPTRTPAALAARLASVCVSDFDVGHNTTSIFVISHAIGAGGSSPLLVRGRISTSTTSCPRSFAACHRAYPIARSGSSVTMSTVSPGTAPMQSRSAMVDADSNSAETV